MARARRPSKKDRLETFYCAIEDSGREWVATGFVDTEFRVMMLNEVSYGTQGIYA